MTQQEQAAVLKYVSALEAASLSYALKYGITLEMNEAIRSRPSDRVWEKFVFSINRATLGMLTSPHGVE